MDTKFDFVRQDENGHVFPAGGVEELALILRQILPDRKKRTRMGAAAHGNMDAAGVHG